MIVRLGKLKSDFTVMPNAILVDSSISFLAKGMMCYLLSKPDNWVVSISDLVAASELDGEDRVQRGLRELRDAGYAELKTRYEHGRARGKEWIIHETSRKPENRSVCTDDPKNRRSEKQTVCKSGQLVSTECIVNTDNKANTVCEARAKKSDASKIENEANNSTVKIPKSKTTSKGPAANDLLFSETQFAEDYPKFETELKNRETLPENLNLRHYYNLLKNWSQAQNVRRADWIAQTLYFINQDSSNGKLKLKSQSSTGDRNSDRINSALERAERLTRSGG